MDPFMLLQVTRLPRGKIHTKEEEEKRTNNKSCALFFSLSFFLFFFVLLQIQIKTYLGETFIAE